MNPFGLVFVAIGALSMLGGIFNWDWFMNSRKARTMVKLLSRTGARIFYGVLGLALVVFGVLGTVGVIELQ